MFLHRANHLAESSNQFNRRAKKVRKKFWWQNMKMKLILGGAVATVLLVILIWICMKFVKGDDGQISEENNNDQIQLPTMLD